MNWQTLKFTFCTKDVDCFSIFEHPFLLLQVLCRHVLEMPVCKVVGCTDNACLACSGMYWHVVACSPYNRLVSPPFLCSPYRGMEGKAGDCFPWMYYWSLLAGQCTVEWPGQSWPQLVERNTQVHWLVTTGYQPARLKHCSTGLALNIWLTRKKRKQYNYVVKQTRSKNMEWK